MFAYSVLSDICVVNSDVDYEYPATAAQGAGLAALLTSLRTALDDLARKKGDSVSYQISVCRHNETLPTLALIEFH